MASLYEMNDYAHLRQTEPKFEDVNAQQRLQKYEQNLRARDRLFRGRLLIGLYAAWGASLISIGFGSYCLYLEMDDKRNGEGAHHKLSHAAKWILPFLIEIGVTVLNECMGSIHGTTLRMALFAEHRVKFRSNLRLLTSSKSSAANKWYTNAVFMFCIIISYAAPSMILLDWNPELANVLDISYQGSTQADHESVVHVSGVALLFLGAGLLGQAIITTWALISTQVFTWSTNPVDMVFTVMDDPRRFYIVHRSGRCMMSVHQKDDPTEPTLPRAKQRPALTAHEQARWILAFLWFLVPLSAAWGVIIYAMIITGNRHGILGSSWSFLPLFIGDKTTTCRSIACIAKFEGTSVLNISWTSSSGTKGMVGTVFVIAAYQAAVTLALHCAELLVDVVQDETIFREVVSVKGTNPNHSNMMAFLKNWRALTLQAFKAVIHWMFGLCINVGYLIGVNMYPPQIFYLAGAMLIVSLFATYVCTIRPKGPLPATFGHLQTIADLIDDFQPRMYWGHKESGIVCYAGTSADSLPGPFMNRLYGEPVRDLGQSSATSLRSTEGGFDARENRQSTESLLNPQDNLEHHGDIGDTSNSLLTETYTQYDASIASLLSGEQGQYGLRRNY
jgi:hypothetical protein